MSNPSQYKFESIGLSSPAYSAEAVTPSDVTNFSSFARALYVGGAGNISVVMRDGETVVFNSLAAGSILPILAARVNATNTTATNIVALR